MTCLEFREETFVGSSKTTKFVKVFSLENFPLYGMKEEWWVRKWYKWRQSAQTQLHVWHDNSQQHEMLAISARQISCLSVATAVYVNTHSHIWLPWKNWIKVLYNNIMCLRLCTPLKVICCPSPSNRLYTNNRGKHCLCLLLCNSNYNTTEITELELYC